MATTTATVRRHLYIRNTLGKRLNCYVHHVPDDEVIAQHEANLNHHSRKLLLNAPVSLKANFLVRDWPSHACSKILTNFNAPLDSTVAERLRSAGALLMGSTNMDEFGMGNDGSTSHCGPTLSPFGPGFSPGGSSSGSGVSVAIGSAVASIGSDTGGSVRLPAAYCGVMGFKPTPGEISRFGLIPYANSLDTPGIIAKDVKTTRTVFEAVRGYDERDSTSLASEVRRTSRPSHKLRIGIPLNLRMKEIDEEILGAWKACEALLEKQLGWEIVPVRASSIREALPAYYVIALAEASSNLARYDGVRYGYRAGGEATASEMGMVREYPRTRSEGFGVETRRRIMMGALALSAGGGIYKKALALRRKLMREWDALFIAERLDAMVFPTAPFKPNHLPNSSNTASPVEKYIQDVFTVPASLAGLPALSLPFASSQKDGAPLAIQIVGSARRDAEVLDIAEMIESRCDFKLPDFS